MGKAKGAEQTRFSRRLADKPKPPIVEMKKRAPVKRAAKPKKAKQAENGNPKAEESKAEATETK